MTENNDDPHNLLRKDKTKDIGVLFEEPEEWQKEWQGMPEFHMGNAAAVRRIVVHFNTHEDVQDFERAIGQSIGPKIKTIWFPKQQDYLAPKNFEYVDEGDES